MSKQIVSFIVAIGLFAFSSYAQEENNPQNFDDFSAFETDPIELDQEVSQVFGRFFQTNMLLGTGLFTSGLGRSNSPGFNLGLRFVYYFDRIWAAELSGGYARHSSFYNTSNTDLKNVDMHLQTTLLPVQIGIRYAFDVKQLPRSIALMNPYIASNFEVIFRSEKVESNPVVTDFPGGLKSKFAPSAIISSRAYGVNFGGGMEFDVYRNKLLLGVDLRYHILTWSDSNDIIGKIDRRGNYFTILGMLTYNY
jgi:hypothetical protein